MGIRMTGEELRKLRTNRQMSRRSLALACGIHPDTVRYWEYKQDFDLRGYALSRMLDALGEHVALQEPRVSMMPHPFFGGFLTPTRARNGVLHSTYNVCAHGKCGAKTRRGTPCRARAIRGKRRCKFHGGLSTGPKTLEGRDRIAAAQRQRWATWRSQIT